MYEYFENFYYLLTPDAVSSTRQFAIAIKLKVVILEDEKYWNLDNSDSYKARLQPVLNF